MAIKYVAPAIEKAAQARLSRLEEEFRFHESGLPSKIMEHSLTPKQDARLHDRDEVLLVLIRNPDGYGKVLSDHRDHFALTSYLAIRNGGMEYGQIAKMLGESDRQAKMRVKRSLVLLGVRKSFSGRTIKTE
jgi:hypothetical protein